MADSLDDKANNKNIKVDAEKLKEEDRIKNHLKVALDIDPSLAKFLDLGTGKDPITHKP